MAKFTGWSAELEAALAEPFPAEFIQQKKKGGSSISFVPWHFYAARLNDLVGPGWSIGALETRDVGGKLMIALPLTIFGTTRVNVGSEDEDKDDFGDASTNAWAQAFKRSCALFSIGLGMYDKNGAMAKHREQAAHNAALDFIRDVGARSDESVMLHMTDGTQQPLKEAVRKAWPTVKRERAAAIAFARAIEDSTGQPFSAST